LCCVCVNVKQKIQKAVKRGRRHASHLGDVVVEDAAANDADTAAEQWMTSRRTGVLAAATFPPAARPTTTSLRRADRQVNRRKLDAVQSPAFSPPGYATSFLCPALPVVR